MESEGRKKSNMAKTDQDIELPECFHASTEASLQRFTRGQSSMVNLHKLLKDHGKMEKKVGQIYDEFVVKWKDRALAQIGSNLAYDEVNSLMKIWMATYKEKQDLHNKLLDTMYAQDGPLRNLQDYINSEEVIAKRKAIQFLYERARKRQVKVEKEIDQLKEDFFLTKDKMVHFKPQMDAAQISQDPHTNFRELLAHWRKLEADVDGAKTSYRQKLQKEKSTRTTFIEDMKRYQNDSDAYERARLQKLQDVMTAMMQCSKTVETQRHEILEPLFEEGISCLDQYNMQKEIDLYNVFYLYQHKFPKEEPHPSEMPSKKAEDDESLQKTPKVDPSVELDIVQVLPAEDHTAVFVQTTVDADTEKPKASRYSRHVMFATPNPKDICYLPEVEIPNVVTDRRQTAAPIMKETTVDYHKDLSDSDSDDDQAQGQPKDADLGNITQGQKVKVYAVKAFTARSDDEISFKAGRKIYVTESAVAGRVYGYIKKGKLVKRRTYGYFPEQLVSTDKKFKVKQSFLKKKLSKQLPRDSSKNYISFMGNSG